MTLYQRKRLIVLHKRVKQHLIGYTRFSTELSTQSKALCHLRKAERLYSQILGIIRDSTSVPAYTGGENFLGKTLLRL
jgi:hypothetical protein